KRNDLHMVLRAQLARYRPKDTRANRFHLGRDQHRRVAVETNDRTVRTLDVLRDTDHDRLHHVALFYAATRNCLFHRYDDDIADRGVFTLGAAKHLDAHDAARTGIVRHIEVGLHLDHDAALIFWSLILSANV